MGSEVTRQSIVKYYGIYALCGDERSRRNLVKYIMVNGNDAWPKKKKNIDGELIVSTSCVNSMRYLVKWIRNWVDGSLSLPVYFAFILLRITFNSFCFCLDQM